MGITLTSEGTHGQQDWGYTGRGTVAYCDRTQAMSFKEYFLPIVASDAGDTEALLDNINLRLSEIKRKCAEEYAEDTSIDAVNRYYGNLGSQLSDAITTILGSTYKFDAYKCAIYHEVNGTVNTYNLVYEDQVGGYSDSGHFGVLHVTVQDALYPYPGKPRDAYIVDGQKLILTADDKLYNIGLPEFSTLNEAIAYVTGDQEPPQPGDDPYDSTGGNSTILPSQSFDEVNETFLNSLTLIAEINQSNLDNIGAALNNRIDVSQDIGDNIMKLARGIIQGNIADGVISIKNIPIPRGENLPYSTGSEEALFNPMGSHPVSGKKLNRYLKKYHIGRMDINRIFNDFRDFMVEYSVYLPFSGIHRLDADVIVGNSILIEADIDFVCGSILYHIIVNDNQNSRDIYQFTGSCALEIPITAKDYTQKYDSIMNGIFTGVGNVAMGSLAGPSGAAMMAASSTLGTVGNALQTKGQYIQSGKLVPNACALSILSPYLIISKPQDRTPNISSTKGRPCHKVKNLSSCSGFTTITNIRLDNIPYATDEDKAALKSMLASGVYL